MIILFYTVIIAWSASCLEFLFTQAWGDDPAGFFTGGFLNIAAASGVSLESDVVDLVGNGDGEYPRRFSNMLGWGMLAGVVAGALLPDVVHSTSPAPRGFQTRTEAVR